MSWGKARHTGDVAGRPDARARRGDEEEIRQSNHRGPPSLLSPPLVSLPCSYAKSALAVLAREEPRVTSGTHAVNPASTRADGVPDDVADVAQVTSDALASYAAMGYRPPPADSLSPACGSNGGDARFDVYLVNMVGADGLTVPESGRCVAATAGAQGTACASFVLAQRDFSLYYFTARGGVFQPEPRGGGVRAREQRPPRGEGGKPKPAHITYAPYWAI